MAAKNILIIDDDAIFCFILQKQLPKHIIPSTKIFYKAEEALSFIAQENGKDDEYLIFLDLNAPGMNGWEFLEAVKKDEYACTFKIVIVTSSINPEDQIRASAYSDIIDFIKKPVDGQELLKILEAF
jgi:CheY-like chemotaxis protein